MASQAQVTLYESDLWPPLRELIDTVLLNMPGTYTPISYEQMYSAVYKAVCKQMGERLYTDLMEHMAQRLKNAKSKIEAEGDSAAFVLAFDCYLTQFMHAVQLVVPTFIYLNRFYVEAKLGTNLKTEIMRSFATFVANPLINRILGT
jgi:hypothetical protein